MSAAALAVSSRYLPSASPAAPVSGTLCHRGLTAEGEAAALQPFGQQAQPVTGRPQQFDLTAAAAPEDEDVAGHRIVFSASSAPLRRDH